MSYSLNFTCVKIDYSGFIEIKKVIEADGYNIYLNNVRPLKAKGTFLFFNLTYSCKWMRDLVINSTRISFFLKKGSPIKC